MSVWGYMHRSEGIQETIGVQLPEVRIAAMVYLPTMDAGNGTQVLWESYMCCPEPVSSLQALSMIF